MGHLQGCYLAQKEGKDNDSTASTKLEDKLRWLARGVEPQYFMIH